MSAPAAPRQLKYARAIREALASEMRRDPRVVVWGEDVGVYGGVFGVLRGLHAEFGGERVIDTPISENLIVGMAVGAAMRGLRPVVELQYADFIFCAGDEVFLKAGTWRYAHDGAHQLPFVVRAACGGSGFGPEHSQCTEAFLMHQPGVRVVVPSTPADAKGLLLTAIRSPDPVFFFEHKLLYPWSGAGESWAGEVPEGDTALPFGRAAIRRAGRDLTIVAWQDMLRRAMRAAELLAREGIEAEVLDPRTLNPFDEDALLDSVRRTGACLVVEEAPVRLGVGAEIGALLCEKAWDALLRPLVRLGLPDVPVPTAEHLVAALVPSVESIFAAGRELARRPAQQRARRPERAAPERESTAVRAGAATAAPVSASDARGVGIPIRLPRLDQSMSEGRLVAWRVAAGAVVRAGEVVCAIETDKAEHDVEAPSDGVLGVHRAEAGELLEVGALLALVLAPGELEPPAPARAAMPAPGSAAIAAPSEQRRARERRRLSPLRAATARRTALAWRDAPHFVQMLDADFTRAMALRQRWKQDGDPRAAAGITELAVAALARALAEQPELNASLAGDELVLWDEVCIGIAMDTPRGLVVPVVRNADRLALPELARQVAELRDAARDGSLGPDALRGGTATVSNLGAYGIRSGTPVLNAGESVLLFLGAVEERAVASQGQLSVRRLATLSLAYDHRAVDGVAAARFSARVKQLLETPDALT